MVHFTNDLRERVVVRYQHDGGQGGFRLAPGEEHDVHPTGGGVLEWYWFTDDAGDPTGEWCTAEEEDDIHIDPSADDCRAGKLDSPV